MARFEVEEQEAAATRRAAMLVVKTDRQRQVQYVVKLDQERVKMRQCLTHTAAES